VSGVLTPASIEPDVLKVLGPAYSHGMVMLYISSNFTSQDYIIPYVEKKWQAGLPDCPI